MNRAAPRSINAYLQQLREALAGQDSALLQDALYDAEEYLQAEVSAHPDKSEADVLELIATTYGAPEEVAAAYVDTEAKVKAALATPRAPSAEGGALRRFFSVYSDVRAYTCVFYMLLALATGIIYFMIAVVGTALSLGFAVLIIGVPFFLLFIGTTRVLALAEGRLLEALTGERMPRRPPHPGQAKGFWMRIGAMLRDGRTWTTLAYLVLMLPLGVLYFTLAVAGLAVGLALTAAPLGILGHWLGWIDGTLQLDYAAVHPAWLATPLGLVLVFILGVVVLTMFMHLARLIGRFHARLAKHLLVHPS
jgi:uncharacterized membrane protein